MNTPNFITEHRYGTLKIHSDLIRQQPDEIMAALSRCLVVRAEHLFVGDVIEYSAFSPEFDQLPGGQIPPEYLIVCTRHDDGTTTFTFTRSPN